MKQALTDRQEGWAVALEGGDYVQTTRKLRDGVGYCCLGVICDIEDHDGWLDGDFSWKSTSNSDGSRYWDLPNTVYKEYGLASNQGKFTEKVALYKGVLTPVSVLDREEGTYSHGVGSLVGLNDDLGASFQQIATFIRTYPEVVFWND